MKNNDYINLSSNLKVHEKYFLDTSMWNRLIDSKDINEFQSILQETRYSESLADVESRQDLDKALDRELIQTYRDFYDRVPDKEVVEILASEYLFHNIKVLLKSYILDEDLSHLYMEVRDQHLETLSNELKEKGYVNDKLPFGKYINFALHIYEESKDPQRLDMSIDRFKNEYMMDLAEETENETFIEYVKNLIDIQNFDMVFRAKKQDSSSNRVSQFLVRKGNVPIEILIESFFLSVEEIITNIKNYKISEPLKEGLELYQEDQDLSHFRNINHYYLFEIVRQGAKKTFGPEKVFEYILRKENEIKALRIANIGKINDMPEDEIRKRVGDQIA